MNMKNEESFFEGFLFGTLFGAAVSAIVALLFAPKSGKDFRKDISEGTAKTLESTDEYLELAREKGTQVIHDVEDAALAYFNLAADKAEDIVEDTQEEVDKVEEVVEEKIEEIQE